MSRCFGLAWITVVPVAATPNTPAATTRELKTSVNPALVLSSRNAFREASVLVASSVVRMRNSTARSPVSARLEEFALLDSDSGSDSGSDLGSDSGSDSGSDFGSESGSALDDCDQESSHTVPVIP